MSHLIQTVNKWIKQINKSKQKSYGEHKYVLGFTIKGNGGEYKVCTSLIRDV